MKVFINNIENLKNKGYILTKDTVDTYCNINIIYSTYLKKFLQNQKEDDLNQGVYDKLLSEAKIRKRLKFSLAFWYTFYISSGYFIAKTFKFTTFLKFWFYIFLIFPNTYFYYTKFYENGKSMHKLLLIYHLKCISLKTITPNYEEIQDKITYDYLKLYK